MAPLVPIPSPGVPLFFGEAGDPIVVVLHDWYGRLPALDAFATALARRGFRVAVPDLYDGVCTVDADDAEILANALDLGTALAVIDDAVSQARGAGTAKVAIVGFSLGGWLGLLHAQGGTADAVVSYYASLSEPDHGIIPCPVLLHWADVDEFEERDDTAAFVERLKEHGTPVNQHTYLGTGHTFANASIPGKIDARAAALSFARTTLFLEQHLLD